MKLKNLPVLFGLLFVLSLVATILLAVSCREVAPVLVGAPEAADTRTEQLMEAICAGDIATVESSLMGCQVLQIGEENNALSQILWETYQSNLSYSFNGSCYVFGQNFTRSVTVTMLDISAVLEALQTQAPRLLTARAAVYPEKAYDETGSYREEFVMEVLADAAQEIVECENYLTQSELTLLLTHRKGQWLVQLNQPLMNVLSGGMGGA